MLGRPARVTAMKRQFQRVAADDGNWSGRAARWRSRHV